MGNIWHKHQENGHVPDEDFLSCPWCGSRSISVESKLFVLEEYGDCWNAEASCHECGATAPDTGAASVLNDPEIEKHRLYVDDSDEREVVNFAVMIWNSRK